MGQGQFDKHTMKLLHLWSELHPNSMITWKYANDVNICLVGVHRNNKKKEHQLSGTEPNLYFLVY